MGSGTISRAFRSLGAPSLLLREPFLRKKTVTKEDKGLIRISPPIVYWIRVHCATVGKVEIRSYSNAS